MRRRRPSAAGECDAALQIRDGRRHLGVGRVGDAPAVDLDGADAAVTRGEQRVALRGHFFEGHMSSCRKVEKRKYLCKFSDHLRNSVRGRYPCLCM